MMGFKVFHSAGATMAGIEAAHIIRKVQIPATEKLLSISSPGSQHNHVRWKLVCSHQTAYFA